MDDPTAKIGAQEITHEDPKIEILPDLREKISEEINVKTYQENGDGSKQQDLEVAQEDATPPPIKVPRSKRRGLLGRFTLLAEVEEPKHYTRPTKWFITFNIALAALAAPLGSVIIFRKHPYGFNTLDR